MNATAKPLILPPPLTRGDTIGLVAPAGPVRDLEAFDFGRQLIEARGFTVKIPDDLFSQQGFLAGCDRDRARQFIEVWRDPQVKMVLPVRGGYGCLRLLPLLDLAELSATPKLLAGYSDLTVLINEFTRLTGLVTYHAPMLNSLSHCDDMSRDSFWRMLSGEGLAPITHGPLRVIRGGRGRGHVAGGNLTTLAHLLGTPHDITWQGAILFLEDTGEPPYRLDRLLTHLAWAGCFKNLAGLILGSFSGNKTDEDDWTPSVWERVAELAGGEYPIWADFPVGHGAGNLALPLGVTAEMDSDSGLLGFSIC